MVSSDGTHPWSGTAWVPVNQTNRWAWGIALAPLAWGAALAVWAITAPPTAWVVLIAMAASVVASAVATRGDVRTLNNQSVGTERSFPAAVLLLYIIAAPVYLIYRTRKAGTSACIPVAWFVAMAFSALSVAFFPASEVKGVELDLAGDLSDALGRPVRVDCPNNADYSVGNRVACDVDNHGDPPHEVVLEMRTDGGYTWKVQQP